MAWMRVEDHDRERMRQMGGMNDRLQADSRGHRESGHGYGIVGAGGIYGRPVKASRIAVKTLTACLRAVDR